MADLHIPNAESCLQILRRTPATLRSVVEMATSEQLDWRPSAERWSISMVLAHLANAEVHGFQQRFTAMMEADRPPLPSYDQMALFRGGATFDGRAELSRFETARVRTLAQLEALPDGAGDRGGQHEEIGFLTVAQLLNEFAYHDIGHVRQVLELFRAHVLYPEMGAYQSYYKINP
jgi:hypothetical protein